MELRIPTYGLVSAGLIGGWLTARYSGNRPLGGVVLAACGALIGKQALAAGGPAAAGAVGGLYLAAFGLSHPLAKKIGPWPAVLSLTAFPALVAYLMVDKPKD